MQIVTDSAADLAPSQLAGLPIHFTSLRLSLGGKPFTGSNEEFYKMLSETGFDNLLSNKIFSCAVCRDNGRNYVLGNI